MSAEQIFQLSGLLGVSFIALGAFLLFMAPVFAELLGR